MSPYLVLGSFVAVLLIALIGWLIGEIIGYALEDATDSVDSLD